MSGDTFARFLTGLAVLAVAVIAAIVSFSHIEALALAHGQPLVAARLLPLSVDGLLVASSLTLLAEARAHRAAPAMARAGLVLGVIATVLANVAFGARFGIVGALISAWPAVSFIVATEILVGQMRREVTIPDARAEELTVAAVPGQVGDAVPVETGVNVAAPVPVHAVPTARVRRSATVLPRMRGTSPGRAPKSPENVFSAELAAGQLPSLRSVMRRMNIGAPKARAILADLQAIVDGAMSEAA